MNTILLLMVMDIRMSDRTELIGGNTGIFLISDLSLASADNL